MSQNALCQYCDVDSGLENVDGSRGGVFNDFFSPIWDMMVSALSTLADVLSDLVLWAFCGVAEGMLYVANNLAVPAYVNSLQTVTNSLDPVVGYLMFRSGFPEALLIIGGGMSFYVLRKLVTLGNW